MSMRFESPMTPPAAQERGPEDPRLDMRTAIAEYNQAFARQGAKGPEDMPETEEGQAESAESALDGLIADDPRVFLDVDEDVADPTAREVFRTRALQSLLRVDPVAAARAYVRIRDARERAPWIEEMPHAIHRFLKEAMSKKTSAEALEMYASLPDAYPGLTADEAIPYQLYVQAFSEEPEGAPIEEKMRSIKGKFLAAAPDALLRVSADYNYRNVLTDEERLEFFKAARDKGDRQAALALLSPNNFSSEGFNEIKADLFEAYRKHDDFNLLDKLEKFPEEFSGLPEEEKRRLADGWIKRHPDRTAYVFGKTLQLDQAQKEDLAAALIGTDPFRLWEKGRRAATSPAEKLGFDEAMLLRLCRERGLTRKFMESESIKNVSDETLRGLIDDLAVTEPVALYERFSGLVKEIGMSPEAAQGGLVKMLNIGKLWQMPAFEFQLGVQLDVSKLAAADLKGLSLSEYKQFLAFWPHAEGKLAWLPTLAKLEKIQARAGREEHDPWKREIDPLAWSAFDKGLLSPVEAADAELFLEFTKEFGATNAPRLLEAYVGLKRAKTVDDVPAAVRAMLEAALGKKRVEKMKRPADLLNELRKFERGVVGDLLKDEIPAGLDSELGLELFSAKIGSSSWAQDDDPKDLIAKWQAFKKADPKKAEVPEGYEEARMQIPLVSRAKNPEPMAAEAIGKPDVQEALAYYTGHFRDSRPDTEWKELAFDALRSSWSGKMDPARDAFLSSTEPWRGFGERGEGHMVKMMENLMHVEGEDTDDLLLRLSADHLTKVVPEHFRGVIDSLRYDKEVKVDAGVLKELRSLLIDYVSEHYLHPAQEKHHVGHAPFSDGLRQKLESLWRLAGDREANPVVKAHAEIERLKKEARKTSQKTKEVALVPAQGLLRVYGGDLADACYTSRHEALSDGQYPDLHAMIFVTGRGTANERFVGSTLFIETETPGGEKVLMVRANNPRENLIQDVDAEALIKATLDEAVATAKRRSLDMVVVPMDEASQSSSNREAVAEYYATNFAGEDTTPLVAEPETNFNSYPNYDPDGGHPVVVIWRKE